MRDDIHRPSVINPEDYEFVAFDYLGDDGDKFMFDERQVFFAHRSRTGGKYSDHSHGGTCFICGAFALNVAKFYHEKTNSYIVAGEDCAAKLNFQDAVGFRSLRERVRAGREAATGKAKAQKFLGEQGLEAAWDIYVSSVLGPKYEENTILDIVGRLVRYGSISDKQVDFLRKLLVKIADRDAIAAKRREENAGSQHVGQIGERCEFNVAVMFTVRLESDYGTINITGFRDQDGNVLIYKGQNLGVEKGDNAVVKATIKSHNVRDGVNQTIINRPKLIKAA